MVNQTTDPALAANSLDALCDRIEELISQAERGNWDVLEKQSGPLVQALDSLRSSAREPNQEQASAQRLLGTLNKALQLFGERKLQIAPLVEQFERIRPVSSQ